MRTLSARTLSAVPWSEATTVDLVLIPDTQYLSETPSWTPHFQAAADWIAANVEGRDIQLILHLGDVVDNGNETEFDRAETPMDTIWDTGIPFAACIGNHDYDGGAPAADRSDTTEWNSYFGTAKYTGRDWWDGDFYESGKSENFYFLTTLAGRDTLVVVLELFPRAAVVTWAGDIIEANPTRDVIVLTHAYLYNDGSLSVDGTSAGPNSYAPTDASSGATMWAEFKQYPNVIAVFNGHFINGPLTAVLEGEGDEGNSVLQQFTNWQNEDQGGDGRIVILSINPVTGWATRRVYNSRNAAFESTYNLSLQFFGDLV